jgi:hypothetical protein
MVASSWIQSGYILYPRLDVSFSHVYEKIHIVTKDVIALQVGNIMLEQVLKI